MYIQEVPEPGTPEWDAAIEKAACAKHFDDEVAKVYAEHGGESESSWERLDLHDAVYGDLAEQADRPSARRRHPPGLSRLHALHPRPGRGRARPGWHCWRWRGNERGRQGEHGAAGEHALYVDYESFPVQIVRRLRTLGVSQAAIDERLHYYHPQTDPDTLDSDRNAFSHLLSREYAVAVIDGANISHGAVRTEPRLGNRRGALARKIMFAHRREDRGGHLRQ